MNNAMRGLLEEMAARPRWQDQAGLNLEDLVERCFDPYEEGVQDGMILLARGLLKEFGGADPSEEDSPPVEEAGKCKDCRFFAPSKVEALWEGLPREGACTWSVPSWPSVWPEAFMASGGKPPPRPALRHTFSNFGQDCRTFAPPSSEETVPDASHASE